MKFFLLLLLFGNVCAAQQKKFSEKYESVTPSGDYFLAKQRVNPVTVRTGVLDANGKVRIPFQYDGVEIVGDQAIVFVIKNLRYVTGVVSLSNDLIIPVNFFGVEAVHQCYAVKDGHNKFGVFSKSGKNLTGFELDSVRRRGAYILLHKGSRAGLMSGEGKMLLPIKYAAIEAGKNIKTQKPPTWFSISPNGQKPLDIEADDITPADGSYIIRIGNKRGVRDSAHQILPPEYADIKSCGKNFMAKTKKGWRFFDVGRRRFQDKHYDSTIALDAPLVFSNFWGMLDARGNEVLFCIYDSVGEKRGSNVLVKMHNGYGIMSASNTPKWIERPVRRVKWITDDLYYACDDGETNFIKNVSGKIIYASANRLAIFDGYFREVSADGRQTDFDFNGRTLRTGTADNKWLGLFSENLQGVCNDKRFGFINKNNQLVIGNRYEDVRPFSGGLAAVKIRYWGFVNASDKFVVHPAYDAVSHFQNHLCIVSRDGRWGIINDKGAEVLALGYDKILRGENCFLLFNKQKAGLANERGEVVIDPRFASLQPMTAWCIAGLNNKFGLISKTGISITPLIYEKIIYNPFQQNFLVKKEGEKAEIPLFKQGK